MTSVQKCLKRTENVDFVGSKNFRQNSKFGPQRLPNMDFQMFEHLIRKISAVKHYNWINAKKQSFILLNLKSLQCVF